MANSINKKDLRNFGFLIGFGFPIIIGLIIPLIYGHAFREWTLWVGISGIILGILKPTILIYPFKAWMKIGHILSRINSPIILGLLFIIIVQPIAIIMKIFKYDPLRKNFEKKNSYKEITKDKKIDLTRVF